MLIAAMNPCPCGGKYVKGNPCRCTPNQIERYMRRISGPLIDRIDIHIDVPAVSFRKLRSTSNGVDEGHLAPPSPDAPDFIAVDKNTGKVLWARSDPGKNVLHGQWSSPALGKT